MYLHQVVVTSRDVVTFGDLGNLSDCVDKFLCALERSLPQLYGAENNEALVKFLLVEQGYLLFDIAVTFEPFEPLIYGS